MSRNNEAAADSTDLRDSDVFAYCSDLPDAEDGTAHAERDDVIHVLVSNSSEINKHWHDDVDSEALLTNLFYVARGQAQLIANLRGVQFAECTVYLSFFDWNTRDFVAKFLRNSETVADYAVTSAEVRDFAETINHQSVKNAAEDHSEAVAGDLNTDGVTSTGNSLGAQIQALADANPDLTDENEYPTDALEARIDLIKRGARDSFIEELCNNPYLEDGYHYDKAGDDITWDDMRSKGYPFTISRRRPRPQGAPGFRPRRKHKRVGRGGSRHHCHPNTVHDPTGHPDRSLYNPDSRHTVYGGS